MDLETINMLLNNKCSIIIDGSKLSFDELLSAANTAKENQAHLTIKRVRLKRTAHQMILLSKAGDSYVVLDLF